MTTTTLLLNGDFSPISVVASNRAVVLVLAAKAEVLEEAEEPVRSSRFTMNRPTVIRLVKFVKIPYRARLPLTRRNLLHRDNHRCAYCPAKGTTIDHVRPRARGGLHRWENVVCACGSCNQAKGDRLLSELGWPPLSFKPAVPTGLVWVAIGVAKADPTWVPYLQPA